MQGERRHCLRTRDSEDGHSAHCPGQAGQIEVALFEALPEARMSPASTHCSACVPGLRRGDRRRGVPAMQEIVHPEPVAGFIDDGELGRRVDDGEFELGGIAQCGRVEVDYHACLQQAGGAASIQGLVRPARPSTR
jgi:hypothetical protein